MLSLRRSPPGLHFAINAFFSLSKKVLYASLAEGYSGVHWTISSFIKHPDYAGGICSFSESWTSVKWVWTGSRSIIPSCNHSLLCIAHWRYSFLFKSYTLFRRFRLHRFFGGRRSLQHIPSLLIPTVQTFLIDSWFYFHSCWCTNTQQITDWRSQSFLYRSTIGLSTSLSLFGLAAKWH